MTENGEGGQRGSLSARINRNLAGMSRAECIVAEYLRDHGRHAIFATAEQIGSATKTSDATVVRTAKSLGFAGLLDLRRTLAAEVVVETSAARHLHGERAGGTDRATGEESVVAKVFAEAAERLAATFRLVDEDEFSAAVDLLDEAREVLSFGLGGSGMLARYLSMRLTRMGRRARASWATGFQLADDLLELRADDLIVFYIPSRLVGEIEVLLDHAHAVGARVLLISSSLGALFGDRVDVTLTATQPVTNYTGEMLTGEVLTDALLLELAVRDEGRATRTSELLTSLRSELVHPDERATVPRRRAAKRSGAAER
ncbi:MurR/RpiR family transcriptional regulator [Amycolatopsis acidiphila]|uniref:MurR/RpiR family transcriptional regulator n=1 Tax=Amycolatopsis acidiphila TaxID=715473 RepID=A0A558A880_9PSEU|nr:MurR/RpiR family transcriptional regulator [Amycolatopsis acidiphila]TVT20465.1 MurR/RpiR family transcriptional regulator [Amycolatopsis acidiphila]UIJ56987.1 MurR/RpiR family transcriptional regulator [Amycolatopsis acidiphila]GHG53961.1 transcriptional regulator [Amycolatopsis acidiphila]